MKRFADEDVDSTLILYKYSAYDRARQAQIHRSATRKPFKIYPISFVRNAIKISIYFS